MPRYVAMLRAINVGGTTVKMERLRALFEQMGLTEVETFIASGNVIFGAGRSKPAALEARIARELEQSLGYAVGVFVRSLAELAAIAQHQPFAAAASATGLYVG